MDKYPEPGFANPPFRVKEILTPREAAQYLSIHVRTIYRLAKNGEIPGRKVGGSWRFKKDLLDEWFSGDQSRRDRLIREALPSPE
jgi:excisionase family DNA binding protein